MSGWEWWVVVPTVAGALLLVAGGVWVGVATWWDAPYDGF